MNIYRIIKQSLILSIGLLIFAFTPAFGFDLGKALSDAVDMSADKVLNNTADSVTDKINQALSSAIPKLDPTAKKDDGQDVDITKGVYIFGYDGCPHSREAYSFMERNTVNYQLMDTQKDAKASRIASENGIQGVPVIYVEGDKFTGFSETEYEKLLKKHGKL